MAFLDIDKTNNFAYPDIQKAHEHHMRLSDAPRNGNHGKTGEVAREYKKRELKGMDKKISDE